MLVIVVVMVVLVLATSAKTHSGFSRREDYSYGYRKAVGADYSCTSTCTSCMYTRKEQERKRKPR